MYLIDYLVNFAPVALLFPRTESFGILSRTPLEPDTALMPTERWNVSRDFRLPNVWSGWRGGGGGGRIRGRLNTK